MSDQKDIPQQHEQAAPAGLPMPPPVSDAEVVRAIRAELWDALRGREIGGDRTLVGMVKRLRLERDEAQQNRRGEYELREHAEQQFAQSQQEIKALKAERDAPPKPMTEADLKAVAKDYAGLNGFDYRDDKQKQLAEAYLRLLAKEAAQDDVDGALTCVCGHVADAHGNDGNGACGQRGCRTGKCERFTRRGSQVAKEAARGAGGWQPIETAPKNGEVVMVWWPIGDWPSGNHEFASYVQFGDEIPAGSYDGQPYRDGWCNDRNGAYLPVEPTHWMPLPDPPDAH